MAEIIRYVDPDAQGANNGLTPADAYTSLNAWNAAEATDLVAAGDTHLCICSASAGTISTGQFAINGWTTSETNFITIRGNLSTGIETEANVFQLLATTDYDTTLDVTANHVIFEDLILGNQSVGSGYNNVLSLAPTGLSQYIVRKSIIHKESDDSLAGAARGLGIVLGANTGLVVIENSIIHGNFNHMIQAAYPNNMNLRLYNSVLRGRAVRALSMEGTITSEVKNNIFEADVGGFSEFVENYRALYGTHTEDYNIASDASLTGVNSINNTALVYADAANHDYSLNASDTVAIGSGTGPAADANVPITDIVGATRSGSTTDIGSKIYDGPMTSVITGLLQADSAVVTSAIVIDSNIDVTVSGSIQAEAAAVSGILSNDPVSEIVTDTITTAAGVGGSIQAQDAVISGSLSVTSSAVNSTVSGSVQAVPASVDATLLVVPPQTAVISGGVQAQPATLSGSLLAFIPYRFKYTTAAKLFSAFGKTEMALITSPEHATVSGDLFYAVMMNNDVSAWSLQQIADANDAASRLADTIQSAEHLIDSYISPRYALPLSQELVDTSPLPTYCNHIVRFMLMDDRTTDEVDKRYDQAMKWLRDVSMNKASLGADDTAVASSPGRMVSRRGRSKLNWDGF
ncbi:MAG TPA: DUF1320 domain-containing protein [Gammaproteobacteria bacterium]